MNASISFSDLIKNQFDQSKDQEQLSEKMHPSSSDEDFVLNTKHELIKHLASPIAKRRADIVGASLGNKICPVLTVDAQWAILALPDYRKSHYIDTVIEKCVESGANKNEIRVITVSPYLLLAISQSDGYDVIEVLPDDDASGHFATFTDIIRYGVINSASDVHLNVENEQPHSQINFTIEGQYTAPPQWRMETPRLEELINVAWQKGTGGGSAVFSQNTEAQCRLVLRINGERIMCRWASLAADRGVSVTLRLLKLDQTVNRRSLESQGFLPSQIAMFARAQNAEGGSIVIAGVVNSGKSTALAELLSMIPDTRKVLTLEDPVEYLVPRALHNTIVRTLDGTDHNAFTSKLKTFKRSAANDILIGEIRDTQTGDAFVDITGSGTNLYCTLHAKSNVQIPERLASKAIGIPEDFLASPGILNLLVYMALIPVLCEDCSKPLSSLATTGGYDRRGIYRDTAYWSEYIKRIELLFKIDSSRLRIKCDEGCKSCRHDDLPQLNGYKGRTAVASMLEPQIDRDMLRYIRQKDTLGLQEYCETLSKTATDDPDMTNKSIIDCAMYKAAHGELDPRDIEQKTMSFDTLERIMVKRKNRP
ncbi:ATPase, T2SS/T4P/T4SS family [Pseudomonas helleri]|uniref:ATPase, T2SS/T4P/T4SS family n=1 Tax=Pseudomonas helleri TaxID=1608996 RepID=UPI003FD22593